MYSSLPQPTIFAHRGASAYAPENTLTAFELALHQGADAIELDAKLTADGEVVVIHDPSIDRTTSNSGRVKDFTMSDLRKMEVGSNFDAAFRGEKIPALDEVFAAFGQLTFINVELTNYTSLTDELPEKVASCVKDHKLECRVLFSSFNPIALKRIHLLIPEAPLGLLALPGAKGALARSWVGRIVPYVSLHPNLKDVSLRLVERTHKKDFRVFVYTVNRKENMKRMFRMNVDGIFTDDPILARRVVRELDPIPRDLSV